MVRVRVMVMVMVIVRVVIRMRVIIGLWIRSLIMIGYRDEIRIIVVVEKRLNFCLSLFFELRLVLG